ncbi:hypothetical protein AKJ09_11278 [Labilithrix luteola]|uniref:Peptidase S1 domain-containing protein n=1 Tax=Labilithrix luteola TaxID=1391654 RepID=A0A0K1QGQ4_9BACT|nr:S1 family peptidase [Labilithrix luteola]AKV04615.1 hypothetical protein AKJ09_11278 [Labilithrix luteola]
MRTSFLLSVPFLSILTLASACTSPTDGRDTADSLDSANLGHKSSAIINGSADTTHQAVVTILAGTAQETEICSGTIVKVDPATHIGWVLTAAHCVNVAPQIVIQGDDFNTPTALHYDIVDYLANPNYDQKGDADQVDDFAVIRIAGVDANTPVIPMASSPDGLGPGKTITAVGFGRTTLINSGSQDTNTIRRSVKLTVKESSQMQISYDMSARGICQGDSGGPDLYDDGSGEKVVAVHSFVAGDCNGMGVSGRVSGELTFINKQLGKAAPAASCDLCTKVANSGTQTCAALQSACLADADCSALYECLSKTGGLNPLKTCAAKYPKGEGPINAIMTCTCNRACVDECGGTSQSACAGVPACGYDLSKQAPGECSTCSESACCQEMLDCEADGTCFACLKGDADADCATNTTRKKLATCVASKCKAECANTGLDVGADPETDTTGSSGASGKSNTVVTTTSGCSTSGAPASSGGSAFLALAAAATFAARRRRAKISG